MKPTRDPRPPWYFGVVFTLAGLLGTVWGLWIVYQAARSSAWPPAPGTILRSEVRVHRGGGGPDDSDSYSPDIEYSYTVGDGTYVSSRIKFGVISTSSPASAESWVNKYRAGATVTVYHDPHRPSEAVLERGLSTSALLPLGAGLVFLATGGTLLALRSRQLSRNGQRAGAVRQQAREAGPSTSGPSSGFLESGPSRPSPLDR